MLAAAAAVVAERELVLASAVVVVAVRSWFASPGTTVPMLLSWPLGSAGVAGLVLVLALETEAEECTTAGSCTLLLLAAEAGVRQHREPLAVRDRRRALANLYCCCLHER